MKKRKHVLLLLLAAVLLISLSACGNKNESLKRVDKDPDKSSEEVVKDPDKSSKEVVKDSGKSSDEVDNNSNNSLEGIINDSNATVKDIADALQEGNLNAEQKAQLKNEFEKEGSDITWDKDGNAKVTDKDGTVTSLSSDWPDNSYTDGLPKPEGVISTTQEDGNEFVVLIDWTLEQAKDYASKVKSEGFDENVEEMNLDDLNMYLFSADNSNAMSISVAFTGDEGFGTITIAKKW